MIRLLLFAALYLSDFSTVNSLQFTGRGFCAATDGGVFVYDNSRGIVASYAMKGLKLAACDINSGEIAFITKDGTLYVYSSFFETLKRIGLARGVKGMGYSSGIIMLIYSNGTRRYVSRFGQPAPSIYIDTMFQAKPRTFPLYLKTRTYENACHVFKDPLSYAPGYDLDFIGTDGNGVYIFDKRMKKLKNTVYLNITPPVRKFITVFDTLYVLHSAGVTKISKNYVSSLSGDCFQYGFYPVDMVYAGGEMFLISRNGFYTADDPYFFTPLNGVCGEARSAFGMKDKSFVVTRHCLLTVSDEGETITEFRTEKTVDYGVSDGKNIYFIIDERLYVLADTALEEIIYAEEPIIAHTIISDYGKVYIPAKRGLFILSTKGIELIRSPFDLLSVLSGIFSENMLYLALPDKVILYDFPHKTWKMYNIGKGQLTGITTITEFEGKLYVGYDKGVLVK